jgi:ribosomal protein L16/L10AE
MKAGDALPRRRPALHRRHEAFPDNVARFRPQRVVQGMDLASPISHVVHVMGTVDMLLIAGDEIHLHHIRRAKMVAADHLDVAEAR